jgi:signal transduction histidine kinase
VRDDRGDERFRRLAPGLVALAVALLVGLNVGTSLLLARHFTLYAASSGRLYSVVYAGLHSSKPGAEVRALFRLSEEVRNLGMPLVVTDGTGRVTATANLPFAAPLNDSLVRSFATALDRENPPVVDSAFGIVHYGPMPLQNQVTVLAILQGLTILVMVALAVFAYRSAMVAQRDRLWVAMAREAAHQLGTPLTSLYGWIERVRSSDTPPKGLADHLAADAERLDRVARRFERIGNPVRREPIGLGALTDRVAGYFRPRLPKRANPITLRVEAAGPGPTITGDPVLLEWALEALVKNAIDALQGRAGTITLRVGQEPEASLAVLEVNDDGPGVPSQLRRSIFEPGMSTKEGGWGIGLALARRVVEDAHDGELKLEPTEKGSSFVMRLPLEAPAA